MRDTVYHRAQNNALYPPLENRINPIESVWLSALSNSRPLLDDITLHDEAGCCVR
jgi:hypothetical protein